MCQLLPKDYYQQQLQSPHSEDFDFEGNLKSSPIPMFNIYELFEGLYNSKFKQFIYFITL